MFDVAGFIWRSRFGNNQQDEGTRSLPQTRREDSLGTERLIAEQCSGADCASSGEKAGETLQETREEAEDGRDALRFFLKRFSGEDSLSPTTKTRDVLFGFESVLSRVSSQKLNVQVSFPINRQTMSKNEEWVKLSAREREKTQEHLWELPCDVTPNHQRVEMVSIPSSLVQKAANQNAPCLWNQHLCSRERDGASGHCMAAGKTSSQAGCSTSSA